jgi:hypothetical protein
VGVKTASTGETSAKVAMAKTKTGAIKRGFIGYCSNYP